MLFEKFGFIQLKFFYIFSDYFIGIMSMCLLVVLVLLSSNLYGLLTQKIICEIICFILFLSIFLVLNDSLQNEIIQNYCNQNFVFYGFNKFLNLSLLSNFSKILVLFFSFFYFLIISNFLTNYKITSFEYLLLLLFAVLGLIFLCQSNDFLSGFLAIELISLISYFLASFRKISSYSIESGIKYLIIGAVSSSFFLIGSSFIYAYLGTITFIELKFLLSNPAKFVSSILIYYFDDEPVYAIKQSYLFNSSFLFHNFFIEMGLIFIIFSIFIKLALAPFHFWSLDVYEGAPSISTFFFSTITKLSFFVFLSRFCFIFHTYYGQFWLFYSTVVGFLSVLFGSFGGLKQKKIKTLLAYSSVSHMGYALLSFSNFSTFGLEMMYFYLFSYTFSNIIVWYAVLGLTKPHFLNNKLSKDLGDFTQLGKSNRFIAFGLIVAFFSLAGIPPVIGFTAKFCVFLTLILNNFYLLGNLIILCSVISTFYYIRLIKILYFENLLVGKLYHLDSKNILVFCFFVFCLIFLFFKPTLLYLFINKMVLFENLEISIPINSDNFFFKQTNQTNFLSFDCFYFLYRFN